MIRLSCGVFLFCLEGVVLSFSRPICVHLLSLKAAVTVTASSYTCICLVSERKILIL